jgi:hypothetical protein
MVDWTILSPTFLTAMVEWAAAVVTVLALGSGTQAKGDARDHGTVTQHIAGTRGRLRGWAVERMPARMLPGHISIANRSALPAGNSAAAALALTTVDNRNLRF